MRKDGILLNVISWAVAFAFSTIIYLLTSIGYSGLAPWQVAVILGCLCILVFIGCMLFGNWCLEQRRIRIERDIAFDTVKMALVAVHNKLNRLIQCYRPLYTAYVQTEHVDAPNLGFEESYIKSLISEEDDNLDIPPPPPRK